MSGTPPPPTSPGPLPATDVHVRMYRALTPGKDYQGLLGDCFLIRIVAGDKSSYILIDCGILKGSPDDRERMRRIADDIVQTTGGHLDLLVITHEHWDHISGFSHAADILFDPTRLTIGKVWMAWTEKSDDPQVKRLRERFDKAGAAFAALADHLHAVAPRDGFDPDATVMGLDAFLGLKAKSAPTLLGRDIMEKLKQLPDVSYLEPGTVLPTPSQPDAPALRAYVLGPPRDEKFLFKDKPSTGPAQETYLASPSFHAPLMALVGMAEAQAGGPARSLSPFAPRYLTLKASSIEDGTLAGEDPGTIQWILDAYYRAPGGNPVHQAAQDRRRIDQDWLGAAGSLALKLDSDTNNTSLALAFDLPDDTTLIFAADAQVGNWLSWHTRTYTDETGRTQTAEQILNRARFYKVGHHGSHNATLHDQGLAMMTRNDLVAAIPTDEALGKRQGRGGWQMPNPRVKAALFERTGRRILRNDKRYTAGGTDPDLAGVDPAFLGAVKDTDLYLEYPIFPKP